MSLNKYEKEKIAYQIEAKLQMFGFTFKELELSTKGERLLLVFKDSAHSYFKNVRLMSHLSTFKETPLYTQVYVNIRFLYGKRESPKVGHKITSFKITLS